MIRPIAFYLFLHFLIFVFSETPENKTRTSYDPHELLSKIFEANESVPRAYYDTVQFPNNNNEKPDYYLSGQTNLQDFSQYQDNNIDGLNKKRRKKKKPKQHYYGLQNQDFKPNLGFGGVPNPAFGGQHYNRPPRPRASIASEALSALTNALTSIALYDDYQCVPRLLCEAAGGGALGSSGILQTVSGLQPLLTLLSAYNGISTNPLFVFGRAVFLGMSSNGNTASCRYGYPLCPTDPEHLVHYLNNHNGGFFRFFNSPQQGQQNIEQFYNGLSQNYGLYNQDQQQNYGLYNPNPQKYGIQKPNLYTSYGQQNYGLAFPYNNYNNGRLKNSDEINIQRRIQNKPLSHNSDDFDSNTKWTFPKTENNQMNYINDDVFSDYDVESDVNTNIGNTLKFPDNNNDAKTDTGYERKTRGFVFPESNRNTHYQDYNLKQNDIYNNRINYNHYINKNVNNINNVDDLRGVRTVYIVRGNGDPSKPEIVNLRPGETIQ